MVGAGAPLRITRPRNEAALIVRDGFRISLSLTLNLAEGKQRTRSGFAAPGLGPRDGFVECRGFIEIAGVFGECVSGCEKKRRRFLRIFFRRGIELGDPGTGVSGVAGIGGRGFFVSPAGIISATGPAKCVGERRDCGRIAGGCFFEWSDRFLRLPGAEVCRA